VIRRIETPENYEAIQKRKRREGAALQEKKNAEDAAGGADSPFEKRNAEAAVREGLQEGIGVMKKVLREGEGRAKARPRGRFEEPSRSVDARNEKGSQKSDGGEKKVTRTHKRDHGQKEKREGKDRLERLSQTNDERDRGRKRFAKRLTKKGLTGEENNFSGGVKTV